MNDYDASATRSNHRRGFHNYFVAQSILDADLLINLPKWKAHQKSAVTGALKNLVGINGDKAYLPHFRRGAPKWGGDEYRDENRWLYWLQTTLRERLQKTKPAALRVAQTRLGSAQATSRDRNPAGKPRGKAETFLRRRRRLAGQ